MTTGCTGIQDRLNAYLDGELDGAGRLLVSQHLEACARCGEVLAELRAVGDLLRARASRELPRVDFAGLAPGVISRTRAEDLQSWRTVLRRATGDWHWALVAGGSVCAALVSLLVVSAVCDVSPRRERADSLAALLNSLRTPAGTFYILATPVGPSQGQVLMRFESDGTIGDVDQPVALPTGFTGPSTGDLVYALSKAVVRPDGRVSDLRSMSRRDRQNTEAILGEIQRLRLAPLGAWSGQLNIQRFGLVTNTWVMGKAL
jgi:Putative zinc-finger